MMVLPDRQSVCSEGPTETSASTITEHRFHGLADSALESLQDQLDALIEEKLDDGDVSLEVCCFFFPESGVVVEVS